MMERIYQLLRYLYFFWFVKPILLIVMGLNVRRHDSLPKTGPAIIAANHNSHLDTMVLVTLFPGSVLPKVRPVAAAEYFMKTRLMAWFSKHIIGIIPLNRKKSREGETLDERLGGIFDALDRGEIVILFPEGSRGNPEEMTEFKAGISYICERRPEVPVYPVLMHGLGKVLPRGEALLVPFFCDVFVGLPLTWKQGTTSFQDELRGRMDQLKQEGKFPDWA